MGSTESRQAVPVYGFDGSRPGTMFYVLHIVALTILSISALVNVGLLIYLVKIKTNKNIFRWPIGERLVAYLAITHMFFGVVHIWDHAYMLAVEYHPPLTICMVFGFFVQSFGFAQTMIVLFTALNAFVMIVKEKKIPVGRYDWGLLLYAFGIPFIVGFIGLGVPFLGPAGGW